MTDIDSVDQTLQLAHAALSPTLADKARARAALGLPVRAPLPVAPLPATPTPWAALRASGKTGVWVSAALLGLGFGAGYWLRHTAEPARWSEPVRLEANANVNEAARRDPGRSTEIDLAAPAAAPSAAADESVESASTTPRVTQKARPHGAEPRRAPEGRSESTDSRAAADSGNELALMRRIERSLRSGEPAFALALLAELEQRYPTTGLIEEREAANVLAHCGLRDAGYQLRAANFLRDRARSVYAERVRAGCGPSAPNGATEHGAPATEGSNPHGHE